MLWTVSRGEAWDGTPCPKCHRHIILYDIVWRERDVLNPQLPDTVRHISCAIEHELDEMLKEAKEAGIADFPGKLYHPGRRSPRWLYDVTVAYLYVKYSQPEDVVKQAIHAWAEKF